MAARSSAATKLAASDGKAGRANARLTARDGIPSELTVERLREIYRIMVRIRQFEEAAEAAFRAAKMRGALHFYSGEEATATGVCMALQPNDYITSTHRGHGHCIAKGGKLNKMMAELYGRVTGYCGGKGGSMHIADVETGNLGANGIVGAGIPIATGAGLGSKLRGDGRVTVCFFGDGAGPTGAFHEGVNFAATMALPVVYVCENNQYGMATRATFANAGPGIWARGAAYGIPGEVVDGNDVFAVYRAAKKAVARARAGDGPSILESKTYRQRGHTIHDQKGYRSKKEIDEWLKLDPIVRFRTQVEAARALGAPDFETIDREVAAELQAALEFAEASPFPSLDAIERDVYAE